MSPEHDEATEDMVSVEDFRMQARSWIADNLPRLDDIERLSLRVRDDEWERASELQQLLYKAGFAGICFPREHGGRGLTREHQAAFNEEVQGHEMPVLLNTPTFTIVCPTILDFGSEDQKREHISAAIRGERRFAQLLSEPSGGSDLAGALTRAEPADGGFRLTGSKIWSSAAYLADYGLCLARTNWDVPKHDGLSMFLLDLRSPGVTIQRIHQVNGNNEFCQEFFDEVWLPESALLGELDQGWTVARRTLHHERTAVGGGSRYLSGSGPSRALSTASTGQLWQLLQDTGQASNSRSRELLAESHALAEVQKQVSRHVASSMEAGLLPSEAGSIIRLFKGETAVRRAEIALELAGSYAVTEDADDGLSLGQYGISFIFRQASALGGGSSEMSRNLISERLLRMPAEHAPDRGVPFREVRHTSSTSDAPRA